MKLNVSKYGFIITSILFLLSFQIFTQDNFIGQREQMIKRQIQARGITDKKILDAFRTVERHKFVLPDYIKHAYTDSPLPIIEGQTISQPYIVAFMTESLDLVHSDKVLEIGTKSNDSMINRFNGFANFSFGFNYHLNNTWTIAAQPIFRYQLNPLIDAPVKKHLFAAGLEIGLRMNIPESSPD